MITTSPENIRAINDLKLSLQDASAAAAYLSRQTGIGFTTTDAGVVVPRGVQRHTGGLVNGSGRTRDLTRLGSRERVVVAEHGEEIIDESDPRHIFNLGRGGGGSTGGGAIDQASLERSVSRAVRAGLRGASFGVQLHAAPDVRVGNVMTYGVG